MSATSEQMTETELLQWLLKQPDPKKANKKLWQQLEKLAKDQGVEPVFYIPYIPLQR